MHFCRVAVKKNDAHPMTSNCIALCKYYAHNIRKLLAGKVHTSSKKIKNAQKQRRARWTRDLATRKSLQPGPDGPSGKGESTPLPRRLGRKLSPPSPVSSSRVASSPHTCKQRFGRLSIKDAQRMVCRQHGDIFLKPFAICHCTYLPDIC